MSKSSKSAQSGLATLKRDWSNASISAASSSSELIEWEPTQPKRPEPVPKQKLDGAAKRLRQIQEALAGMKSAPAPTTTTPSSTVPLNNSTAANKRPSLDSSKDEPVKKKRHLPPTWENDILSGPSFKTTTTMSSNVSSQRSERENRSRMSDTNRGSTTGGSDRISASPKDQNVAKVFLSKEQAHILKLAQEGHSLFYTGSAGTGKSVLLREIIKSLRKQHKARDAVAITASTGIAACNIGGVTIHSFAGIGLGRENVDALADRVRKNKKALTRWLRTKVLIIDEVSMVDGDLFDKLARIGSIIRKNLLVPFGGIQVIVTGDFFQLPPVGASNVVKFAFEAETWNETIKRTFNLTKVFRQKDQEFVDMLNEMRFGRLSRKSIAKFMSLSREIIYDDGLGPTELFPRRDDVDRSNFNRMKVLDTEELRFRAQDGGTLQDPDQRAKMLANFMAPGELRLKVNAQVMLIKNVDENLVNGTMGRILRFVDPSAYLTDEGVDPAHAGTTTTTGGAIPKKTTAGGIRYPEVEFSLANGGRMRTLVMPETWKVELPNGEVQVSRTQLPLILAWAMSIHKSQGQTLDRVKVDLSRVFEKGQAYVALSRATSLDGLQVLNFDPHKVNAHEKVAKWSRTLETISEHS